MRERDDTKSVIKCYKFVLYIRFPKQVILRGTFYLHIIKHSVRVQCRLSECLPIDLHMNTESTN